MSEVMIVVGITDRKCEPSMVHTTGLGNSHVP